jgi:hypothetical protein
MFGVRRLMNGFAETLRANIRILNMTIGNAKEKYLTGMTRPKMDTQVKR